MKSPLLASEGSLWSKVQAGVRRAIGAGLEFVRAPGMMREFEYVDEATDDIVYFSTGARYSVLHIGVKSFFFDRVTGRFDGTGQLLEERVADRLELLD